MKRSKLSLVQCCFQSLSLAYFICLRILNIEMGGHGVCISRAEYVDVSGSMGSSSLGGRGQVRGRVSNGFSEGRGDSGANRGQG